MQHVIAKKGTRGGEGDTHTLTQNKRNAFLNPLNVTKMHFSFVLLDGNSYLNSFISLLAMQVLHHQLLTYWFPSFIFNVLQRLATQY